MSLEQEKPSPREQVSRVSGPIAEKLHALFPDLSPNQVTIMGLLGTSLALWLNSEALKKKNPKLRIVAALGYVSASMFDALDGALAREIINTGGKHDSKAGQLVDVGADRASEAIAAIIRLLRAKDQQDKLGTISAGLNGLTNFLPSLLRALAESQGKQVPETGRDILELLGTRAGRLVVTAGNFFPEIKHTDITKWLDLLVTSGNLKTSLNRFNISQNSSIPITLSQESQDAAKNRLKMLGILTGLGFATIGTAACLSLKSLKKPNRAQP